MTAPVIQAVIDAFSAEPCPTCKGRLIVQRALFSPSCVVAWCEECRRWWRYRPYPKASPSNIHRNVVTLVRRCRGAELDPSFHPALS